MNYFLVFSSAFCADFVWIAYMDAAAKKHVYRAAVWSAVLLGLAGFNIVSYAGNHWLVLAAMVGGFLGTCLAMRFKP